MRILGIVVLGIAAVLNAHPVSAATEQCNDAISAYNSAVSDVSDHLEDTLDACRAAPVTMIVHQSSEN